MLRPLNLIPHLFNNSFLLPAIVIGAAFISIDASAQTCRVSIGTTSQGHAAYMEAFEYDYVSVKPCYPGGDCQFMEFINSTRQYPEKAYNAGIQGRVTCSFIVNANGSISHIRILKSVEESLNREAIRILSLMPDWTPGKLEGRAVPVRVIRSIPFRK